MGQISDKSSNLYSSLGKEEEIDDGGRPLLIIPSSDSLRRFQIGQGSRQCNK